jgi:thiamine kinase-like enzyme
MGEFQLFLNTLPVENFGETIKGFHNTPGRLETFLKTVKEAPATRKKQAAAEIRFAEENQDIAHELKKLLERKTLPKRVTHNDTKLDNILFTADGSVLIIDLDTIMPGSVIYDYGDMVRTFTSPAKEDEPDASKVQLRRAHFEALTKGYLEPRKDVLTEVEKESLLLGAEAIIYEQALRFLNDFLQGDIYYKTAYPGHNLVRTRTQIKLLQEILEKEKEFDTIIKQFDN